MATCSYCQQRKGKRTCPALGGTICSPCCGQHRLVEIVCPSNCFYPGGLSVVRDASATPGFTKDDYNAAWDKLHAFAESSRDTRNQALSSFFDPGSEPAEREMGVATGYLYYGFRHAKRQRLVDRFLAARGRALPPGQVAAVVALQQAWASLFEVASVQTGIGLELPHSRPRTARACCSARRTMFAGVMDRLARCFRRRNTRERGQLAQSES